MALRFAYNTNGAANHRLDDALSLIADSGYDGVALTLDHHHFDPFEPDLERRAEGLARRLRELGLGLVIETGARYLLDPRVKHEPTLLNPTPEGRARRIDFLTRCIRIAAICEAEAVSFWAGVPQPRCRSRDRLGLAGGRHRPGDRCGGGAWRHRGAGAGARHAGRNRR